ncbi:MAG: hypothetical protein JNJ71_19365 [Rubrivivax sp.]|nr:hypothetical protein [Rubrivivax sp.]
MHESLSFHTRGVLQAAGPQRSRIQCQQWLSALLMVLVGLFMAGCGGGGNPVADPPTPIVISAQPSDQAITAGTSATFSVSASGGALSYQWQVSSDGSTWTAISGATGSSLNLQAVALASNGTRYRVVVGNGTSNVNSASALLSVTPMLLAPAITVQPEPVRTTEGSGATFTVAASGTSLAYRWERSGASGSWAAVPGATSNTLSLTGLTVADDGSQVRVVVSNSAGSVNSVEVSLNVSAIPELPIFTTQPSSITVVESATASFTVSVQGNPAPSLQWQLSTNSGGTYSDVAGATGTTYTTPAATLAMSGQRFRAVATNSTGSTPSAAAVLTVSPVVTAPTITTAPASVTVIASQAATFTAAVSGSPTPGLRWQLSTDGGLNFNNISGATALSYTLGATTLTQNGYRFRIVATNSAGSATSPEAVLTVNAPVSVLSNRAWSAGQLLEQNDRAVESRAQGIDDMGRATVAFVKDDGTRNVLYVTRGTPGAAPAAPVWTAPVALDTAASAISTTYPVGINVAPSGNVVVHWVSRSACSSSTYSTSGNCNYLYLARYLIANGAWEAPTLVASIPNGDFLKLLINDRGDLAGRLRAWVRTGTSGYTSHLGVIWRASGASSFGARGFMEVDLTSGFDFRMDNSGNLLLAAEAKQNATTDLVAYRGDVSSGMGAQQILDTRGSDATLLAVQVGINGQQVVVWAQSNGTTRSFYAATSPTPVGSFSVQELGPASLDDLFGEEVLTVADNGDALLLGRYNRWQMRWVGGAWQPRKALPSGVPTSTFLNCSHARSGNFMCVGVGSFGEGNTGRWRTYDAGLDAMIQLAVSTSPSPGYVLGVNTINMGTGYSDPFLSVSGHAIITMRNGYDVLPSPTVPNGDARSISNLWATFFR